MLNGFTLSFRPFLIIEYLLEVLECYSQDEVVQNDAMLGDAICVLLSFMTSTLHV